ncbi:MAG: anti-sigma factor family protein, partial [Armatimonadota bacterium]
MSCHEIETLLSEYIDGELRDNDAEFIRCHIAKCDNCAKLINDLRTVSKITASIPDVDPPAFIMANILAKTVYRQSFADKLISVLRTNRVAGFAGAASAFILIAVAMWMNNTTTIDKQSPVTNLAPSVKQSNTATSDAANQPSTTAAFIEKIPQNTDIKNNMRNIRENRVNHKQYTYHFRKTSISNRDSVASIDGTKLKKKADFKTTSSIVEKVPVEMAKTHGLNTDNEISVTPSVESSDTKTDSVTKVDIVANDKPTEQGIRTAKALAAERDNRLIQEVDALKDMRDKL